MAPMFGADPTEVLVVGAGPVGMLTSVLLSKAGIQVTIIDEEWRTAAHSYACALHPATLKLLDRVGLAGELLQTGYRIETVAFYQGRSRRLELKLKGLPTDFPFVLVVPQSALEGVLEEWLKRKGGVTVHWNHRLAALRPDGDSVVAAIDKLGGTVMGYSVPTWEVVVQKQYEKRAVYVIGADGRNSLTRRLLGIPYEQFGHPEVYAVYEFASDAELGPELRIALDQGTTNALWPLPGGKCRWSFQMPHDEGSPPEFPAKERRPVRFYAEETDETIRHQVHTLVTARAPWFEGQLGELDWALKVQFGRALARQFGRGRCWLAGDATHQTSPLGMQSVNVGLSEAEGLARRLKQILREKAGPNVLDDYSRERQNEWRVLLGLTGELRASAQADPWTKDNRARILNCLPASAEELDRLLDQIGLQMPD